MHYLTDRSHQMQKHMVSVTCLGMLFMKSVPVPPENYKERIDISFPGRTGMHDMTRTSHRVQKHKF
jgi:hypothetical protein